jgi:hypothetical protein
VRVPECQSASVRVAERLCESVSVGVSEYLATTLTDLKQKGKGKAVLLQPWSGPEGSRKLRFTDIKTTVQDGGKIVSLTHQLPLPPGNTPGTHFC